MTKQHNKTIIVTTHYIEEARLADCVSFKYLYLKNIYNHQIIVSRTLYDGKISMKTSKII